MGEKDGKGAEGLTHSMCEEGFAKWKAQNVARVNTKNVGVASVPDK